MWSHLYWYYNIRSDADYLQELPSIAIEKVLENTGWLVKSGSQSFTNREGFPWIDIVYIQSNKGNYAYHEGDSAAFCNLIAVRTSKQNKEDEKRYVALLMQVATELGWELVLETDDDGNEEVVIKK